MDYKEEQEQEIEALESIYSEELTITSRDPFTFNVMVKGSNEDTRDSDIIIITAEIQFTFVEDYPDSAPLIEIADCSELLNQKRTEELLSFLIQQAEDNLGMVMIFTLVSEAQELLLKFVDDVKKEIELEKEKLENEQRLKDEIKYKGTPVTLENFLAWKIQFDEEMRAAGKKKASTENKNKKLTGRQLFEQDATLNNSDMQFVQEHGVAVDESLFQDLDDLDLDDEEFD